MTNTPVPPLMDGSLDIIGDVHGELDALRALLTRLGYDIHGRHRTRRLVFVGDLCDRGPDSVGVVQFVQRLVEEGRAQCVLGNHELNILRRERKHGNHWFFGDSDPKHARQFGETVLATEQQAESIWAFFAALPIALERDDLRVVHAAWWHESVEACRDHRGAVLDVYAHHEQLRASMNEVHALKAARDEQEAAHRDALARPDAAPPFLEHIAAYDAHYQMSNPVRVVTSGVERATAQPFYAGGKWRFVERVPWWRTYHGHVPVVFGHYWRAWSPSLPQTLGRSEPNLFDGAAPDAWQLNEDGTEVGICIDYSVGARYAERRAGRRAPFGGRLAALRWPERELVFDDDRCGS